MLERQKPFEPVEMVFHEEMDLRDPIATGKHGQQAHGNDFGQIVHRSVSGPRILDGFKYHQHAVHLGHHCSSLVTMHLGIRLERAWRLASCPPWVFALSRDEISNEKALGLPDGSLCEARVSCTVLRGAGSAIPPAYSPRPVPA